MADRQNVIRAVDSFYGEIIEKYKELERQIADESRLINIFKKVDYKARIGKLKELKKRAQSINLKRVDFDTEDELAAQVMDKLGRAISLFVSIIDAQVSCQTILYKKSEGEKTDTINYKKAVYHVQKSTEALQNGLREMDADYANLEEYE